MEVHGLAHVEVRRMATESSYHCLCGQSRLIWTDTAKLDATVRCVQHIHRTAECPGCGRRYVVRVAYCSFRPMRKLSERWLAIEPDGVEHEVDLGTVTHAHS